MFLYIELNLEKWVLLKTRTLCRIVLARVLLGVGYWLSIHDVGSVEVLLSIQIYFMKGAIVTHRNISLLDRDEPK